MKELAKARQETGKDYIGVLITADLLDYTVDALLFKVHHHLIKRGKDRVA